MFNKEKRTMSGQATNVILSEMDLFQPQSTSNL